MTRKWRIAAIFVAAVGLGLTMELWPVEPYEDGVMDALAATGATVQNRPVEGLQLVDPNGQLVPFSRFAGRIVYLNFWAEWCDVCKSEMPSLNQFAAQNRQLVEVVTVTIDEDPSGSWSWLSQHFPNGPSFHVYADPGGQAASQQFGTSGVPETFVIDRSGTIVAHYVGPREFTEPVYRELVTRLTR